MSKFTDTRDAVEKFVSHGLHAIWVSILSIGKSAEPVVVQGLEAIGAATVKAALEAKNGGAKGEQIVKAGLTAAESSAKTVGLDISLQEIGVLAGMATAHVSEPDAPMPPAEEAAADEAAK